MGEDEAFSLIKRALDNTSVGLANKVELDSHLVDDGIVDSLDSMNFLFELEQICGKRFEEIDEKFDDFRVSRLLEIVRAG